MRGTAYYNGNEHVWKPHYQECFRFLLSFEVWPDVYFYSLIYYHGLFQYVVVLASTLFDLRLINLSTLISGDFISVSLLPFLIVRDEFFHLYLVLLSSYCQEGEPQPDCSGSLLSQSWGLRGHVAADKNIHRNVAVNGGNGARLIVNYCIGCLCPVERGWDNGRTDT